MDVKKAKPSFKVGLAANHGASNLASSSLFGQAPSTRMKYPSPATAAVPMTPLDRPPTKIDEASSILYMHVTDFSNIKCTCYYALTTVFLPNTLFGTQF